MWDSYDVLHAQPCQASQSSQSGPLGCHFRLCQSCFLCLQGPSPLLLTLLTCVLFNSRTSAKLGAPPVGSGRICTCPTGGEVTFLLLVLHREMCSVPGTDLDLVWWRKDESVPQLLSKTPQSPSLFTVGRLEGGGHHSLVHREVMPVFALLAFKSSETVTFSGSHAPYTRTAEACLGSMSGYGKGSWAAV